MLNKRLKFDSLRFDIRQKAFQKYGIFRCIKDDKNKLNLFKKKYCIGYTFTTLHTLEI